MTITVDEIHGLVQLLRTVQEEAVEGVYDPAFREWKRKYEDSAEHASALLAEVKRLTEELRATKVALDMKTAECEAATQVVLAQSQSQAETDGV